mgnify:CR=1 FL=1
MIKVGEHITLDIIGTTKEYDPSVYERVIHKIAKAADVTILNISKYKFEPQGFTILALLAESHISFHTFPEKGIISFDFFTCGKISPSVAIDIVKNEFEHKRIVKKEFNRDTRSLYHDIYSSPGLQKSYVVNEVLEDFKSKVGQHIEILELEQFGKSLFIDGEIQVAASDEHLYSSTFVGAGLKLNKDNERAAIIGGGDGGVGVVGIQGYDTDLGYIVFVQSHQAVSNRGLAISHAQRHRCVQARLQFVCQRLTFYQRGRAFWCPDFAVGFGAVLGTKGQDKCVDDQRAQRPGHIEYVGVH